MLLLNPFLTFFQFSLALTNGHILDFMLGAHLFLVEADHLGAPLLRVRQEQASVLEDSHALPIITSYCVHEHIVNVGLDLVFRRVVSGLSLFILVRTAGMVFLRIPVKQVSVDHINLLEVLPRIIIELIIGLAKHELIDVDVG